MNMGVAAGVALIVVGMIGAMVGQFRTRHDRDIRTTGRRLYMLVLMTMAEVSSVVCVAIVVAHARHALPIAVAVVWLVAWSYLTASEWRRFLRDHRDQDPPW